MFGATAIQEYNTMIYVGGNVKDPNSPTKFVPAIVKLNNAPSWVADNSKCLKTDWARRININVAFNVVGVAGVSIDNIFPTKVGS